MPSACLLLSEPAEVLEVDGLQLPSALPPVS
jgi:hypothetical protein